MKPGASLRIVRNAARCRKCSDVIESRHRHDFVTCGCGAISVDGGRSYLRRAGDVSAFEELSVYEDASTDVTGAE